MNKPRIQSNVDKPKPKEAESSASTGTTLSKPPTATSSTKEQESSDRTQFSKKWVSALAAIWRAITWLFRLLEGHNAAVTAVATIAIAVLTAEYVNYSKKQWEAMENTIKLSKKQVDDAEAVQSARLSFGNFRANVARSGKEFSAEIMVDVTNHGQTMANEVTFWFQQNQRNLHLDPTKSGWVSSVMPGGGPPEPSSTSLGPKDTKTYKFRLTWPSTEEIRGKKIEISTMYSVKYRDVFQARTEDSHTVSECAVYSPDEDKWFTCPDPTRPRPPRISSIIQVR